MENSREFNDQGRKAHEKCHLTSREQQLKHKKDDESKKDPRQQWLITIVSRLVCAARSRTKTPASTINLLR